MRLTHSLGEGISCYHSFIPDNELVLNDAPFLRKPGDKDRMAESQTSRYHLLNRPGSRNLTPFRECTQSSLLFLLTYSSFWEISYGPGHADNNSAF